MYVEHVGRHDEKGNTDDVEWRKGHEKRGEQREERRTGDLRSADVCAS